MYCQKCFPHICVCLHLLLKQDVQIQSRCSLRFLIIAPQLHKSKVHFNNCFSYDALKFQNDLPLEMQTAIILFHVSKGNLKTVCFKNLSLPSQGTPPPPPPGIATTEHQWSPRLLPLSCFYVRVLARLILLGITFLSLNFNGLWHSVMSICLSTEVKRQ